MHDLSVRFRWIIILFICSFSFSVFQAGFIRIISYVFPVQMIFAVSIVSAAALFISGAGAISAIRFSDKIEWISLSAAISIILTAGFLFYAGKHGSSGYSILLLSSAVSVLPFFLFGIAGGICYINQQKESSEKIPLLVAFSSIAFFSGFVISGFLITYAGVWNLVLFSSMLTATLFPKRSFFSAIMIAVSFTVFFIDPGSELFKYFSKKPVFWFSEGENNRHVAGSWSPYARVDFFETETGALAGMYNGVQYWMTGKIEEDVLLRRELYKNFNGDSLVIGTGGGHGLLSFQDPLKVDAVELDPEVVRFMKNELSSYNGNIYNRIRSVSAGDGRAFVENVDKLYDNIILEAAEVSLSNHSRSIFSFENYLYTLEAVDLYFKKLKHEGVLTIIHTENYVPTEKFIKALPENTVFSVFKVPIKIPGNDQADFTTMVTIASRSYDSINFISADLISSGLDAQEISRNLKKTDKFINSYAVRDDSPALHYNSFSQLVPFILLTILFFSFSLTGAFFSGQFKLGVVFILTGMAYMMLQLCIINSLRSCLGGYIETAAVSLGFLTVGYATGAVLSSKMKAEAIVSGIIISGTLSVLLIMIFPFDGSFLIKLSAIMVAVFPTGVFTGAVFPRALRLDSSRNPSIFIGIDTVSTAAAFLLFYIVVTLWGFIFSAVISVLLYVFAAASILLIERKI